MDLRRDRRRRPLHRSCAACGVAATAIGNQSSALQRVKNFVERYAGYMRREPDVIVLFAEDFDAIDVLNYQGKYRFVRGPSRDEYR